MARDLSAYLQDIYDACVAIEEVIEGFTLDDYGGRRAIIDFRNLLTHDYGAVDDDSVFGLVHSDLIALKAEVGLLPCLFTPCGQVMASVQRIKRMPITSAYLSKQKASHLR
jgi:uncharacterized protein with HEPN domain